MQPLSSLQDLEASLKRLVAPETFILPQNDLERIFSIEEGIVERVERFAIEHGCRPVFWHDAIVFEKLAPA